MNRAQWETKAALGRLGFRDIESLVASRRKAERRQAELAFIGEERRQAERRATADSAIVANWTRRFHESRGTIQTGA